MSNSAIYHPTINVYRNQSIGPSEPAYRSGPGLASGTEGDDFMATTLPTCIFENLTVPFSNGTGEIPLFHIVLPYVTAVCFSIICLIGFVGNSLVIYVVLRFAKMKTVTNMYILNLALSDILFLVTLPMTITTTMVKHWLFGDALCKIHLVLFSLNLFGGVFNLCVMSADRYLAVCHPIRSMKYRTPRIALISCCLIWLLSFMVVLPVILYTTTVPHRRVRNAQSCTMEWPPNQAIPPNVAFIWYCFILGFAIPVPLICVFYILVILRLRHVGPAKKSKEKRKSHRRVTRLVLSVITVYIVCWLPYWCFQMKLVFHGPTGNPATILVFQFFTVLSYTNSMLNPFLYAFLSDNFRKSFVKAFNCLTPSEVGKSTVGNENSIFPRTSQTCTRNGTSQSNPEERMELSVKESGSSAGYSHLPLADQISSKSIKDEQGFLKPPTQL